MLSKNQLKLIRSLGQKKYRDAHGLFLAEGPKLVNDLLPHFRCTLLSGTADYLTQHAALLAAHAPQEVVEISPTQLEQASQQRSPREVLALFVQPQAQPTERLLTLPTQQLCLALDGVQDPGNLGTILRIADWFGITQVFCSLDTADAFAPKVIQATMGAIARTHAHYVDLPHFLAQLPPVVPIFGTLLDGTDCYEAPLATTGVIVMGNEGQGISPAVAALCTQRLLIPHFPADRPSSESLNVAIATAITCAEFRRRQRS